ncbi:MAG: hypothetical protein WC866_04970 [Patescibacteria group bacterium]|jgi:hypothetical protein
MRASNKDEECVESSEQRECRPRYAPHLHMGGRLPTTIVVEQYERDILTRESEESIPRASVQYSRVTIGHGRTRFLGPKKLNQFLSIELGLRDWLEQDEPDEDMFEYELDDDAHEDQASFSELEADDNPHLN